MIQNSQTYIFNQTLCKKEYFKREYAVEEQGDGVIVQKEYKSREGKCLRRFLVFDDYDEVDSRIHRLRDDQLTFHEELISDDILPLVIDYELKRSDVDDWDSYDPDWAKDVILSQMEQFCDDFNVDSSTIVIEDASRDSKISYHIKVFGVLIELRYQRFLITHYFRTLDISECDAKYILRQDGTTYYDIQIYPSTPGTQKTFRIHDNCKIDEPESRLKVVCNPSNYSRVQLYINNKTSRGNNVVEIDVLPSDIDKSIKFLNYSDCIYEINDVTLNKDDVPDDRELLNQVITGDRWKMTVTLDNFTELVSHLPDGLVDSSHNWRKYSRGVKSLMSYDDEDDKTNKKLYKIWDAFCKTCDDYDKDENREKFFSDGMRGCKSNLISLAWLAKKNGSTIIRTIRRTANTTEDMINTTHINEMINEDTRENIYWNLVKGVSNSSYFIDILRDIYLDFIRLDSFDFFIYDHTNRLWLKRTKDEFFTLLEQVLLYVKDNLKSSESEINPQEKGSKCKSPLSKVFRVPSDIYRTLLTWLKPRKLQYLIPHCNEDILPFSDGLCYDARNDCIRQIDKEDYAIKCIKNKVPDMCDYTWIRNIFRDIISNDNKTEEENDRMFFLFEHMLGYIFSGCSHEQKMFVISGEGSNGKSMITEIIYKVLEEDLATTLSGHILVGKPSLEEKPDSNIASIIGKRCAIISEIGRDDAWNITNIKRLTGCDRIPVRDLYEQKYDASHCCKMVLITNHIPKFDDDFAFNRRFVIFDLVKTYLPAWQYNSLSDTTNQRIAEPGLLKKILEDRDALLSYVIYCMRHYYKSGREIQATNDKVKEYAARDPVLDSLNELIVKTGDIRDKVIRTDLAKLLFHRDSIARADYKRLDTLIKSYFDTVVSKSNGIQVYKGIRMQGI